MATQNHGYYDQKLSAARLKRCYDIAPPRIRQYLQAEIDLILSKIDPNDIVLELGCGYGRVLKYLAGKAKTVVGIDTSLPSLLMAKKYLTGSQNHCLVQANAIYPAFRSKTFNLVCCIQNGISAFKVDNEKLIEESSKLLVPGGRVIFSSYLKSFWEYRLEWFRIQAGEGLLGEIDYSRTGNGEICCKDGFRARTVESSEFIALASRFDFPYKLYEIDNSSLFCEIVADK